MRNDLINEWGLVRIDDRLIHGQVLAVWIRSKKFSIIQIVDDQIAKDPFMVEVMRLSAPSGLQIFVENLDESIRSLTKNSNPQETMILTRSPEVILKLYDSGILFNSLNVGGIGMGPGRKNVFRNSYLSVKEYQILKSLYERGVRITFQTVPGENSKEFSEISSPD